MATENPEKYFLNRLAYEIEIGRANFELIIGTDEAGRGPLAGPVVAGAVAVLDPNARDAAFCGLLARVNDSKKLTPQARNEIYYSLTRHPAIAWGVAVVGPAVIDRINILQASKLAMRRSIQNLCRRRRSTVAPDRTFCLIDGNQRLEIGYCQETVVGGDRKIFSISAASIIAKVRRDRIMEKMEKIYPGYSFGRHKGYGTAVHMEALARLGPCLIHRRSFWPVAAAARVSLSPKRRLPFA
jgi:ribonuclease HII